MQVHQELVAALSPEYATSLLRRLLRQFTRLGEHFGYVLAERLNPLASGSANQKSLLDAVLAAKLLDLLRLNTSILAFVLVAQEDKDSILSTSFLGLLG